MAAPAARDDVAGSLRTARTIGVALLASVLVFTVLVEAIARELLPMGDGGVLGENEGLLRYVFFALALSTFGLSFVVKRASLGTGPAASRGAGAPGSAVAPGRRLLTASTVSLSNAEAIALYGFVVFLLTRRLADFYPFLGLALIAFAVHFPRRERWESWARQRP